MNGSTPKTRARELRTMLKDLYDEGRGATKANIIDMLADLRHLCDLSDLVFADCDRIAYRYYVPEAIKLTKLNHRRRKSTSV